jgi:hypothetical protein
MMKTCETACKYFITSTMHVSFGCHVVMAQVHSDSPWVLILEVQEKLAVWTCANDASSLAVGLSPSVVEVPVEIPLASVLLLAQWTCHLMCAPCLDACKT